MIGTVQLSNVNVRLHRNLNAVPRHHQIPVEPCLLEPGDSRDSHP
jgi:hypothetical protein